MHTQQEASLHPPAHPQACVETFTKSTREGWMGSQQEPGAQAGVGIHRRRLAHAAWAIPVLTTSWAAPVMATSTCVSGTARVDPVLTAAASGRTAKQYSTTPLSVTIPAGACAITYTIQGAGGGWHGGRGAFNTGTITRTNASASLTLTLIAAAPGIVADPATTDSTVGGGLGYGNGGTTTWLGYTNGGFAQGAAGGGGGGSAILLGAVADAKPLVVAGGGAGSGGTWGNGSGTLESHGALTAGDAGFPGMDPAAGGLPSQMSPTRPYGRALAGTPSAYSGYGIGTGVTAAQPAFGANGATGGARALPSSGAGGADGSVGGLWYGGPEDASRRWAVALLGASGGNHGTGHYGGGNGGNGHGTSPSYPSWLTSPDQRFAPAGGGGGGYAGGGGGLTYDFHTRNTTTTDETAQSFGTGGGGGSSYVASGSVAGGGNTVSVTPDTWSLSANPSINDGLAGFVTLSWY